MKYHFKNVIAVRAAFTFSEADPSSIQRPPRCGVGALGGILPTISCDSYDLPKLRQSSVIYSRDEYVYFLFI
jgi:hypothetical protein